MFGGREGEGMFTGVEGSMGGKGDEGEGRVIREWGCGAQRRRERVGGREVMREGTMEGETCRGEWRSVDSCFIDG